MRHEITATNARLHSQPPVLIEIEGYDGAGGIYVTMSDRLQKNGQNVQALLTPRAALVLADVLISEATRRDG